MRGESLSPSESSAFEDETSSNSGESEAEEGQDDQADAQKAYSVTRSRSSSGDDESEAETEQNAQDDALRASNMTQNKNQDLVLPPTTQTHAVAQEQQISPEHNVGPTTPRATTPQRSLRLGEL